MSAKKKTKKESRIGLLLNLTYLLLVFVFMQIGGSVIRYIPEIPETEEKEVFSWESQRTIMHAMGGLDGMTYLNSAQSFKYYYSRGARFFEVDLVRTEDDTWVCRHSWNESYGQYEKYEANPMNSDDFLSHPLYKMYTPMTFETLIGLLKEHPDAYIFPDIKKYSKRDYENSREDYLSLMELIRKNECEEVMDQIIPEVYNMDMYAGIKSVYEFPSYLYAVVYDYTEEEIMQFIQDCAEQEIPAISLQDLCITENILQLLREKNMTVVAYTINDKTRAKDLSDLGVQIICTDFLLSEDF